MNICSRETRCKEPVDDIETVSLKHLVITMRQGCSVFLQKRREGPNVEMLSRATVISGALNGGLV